jgi:hypothetical protein
MADTDRWDEYDSKMAKVHGMMSMDAQAMFDRDSKRLDAKARAAYKKMGIELEPPQAGNLSIVADNIEMDDESMIAKAQADPNMGDIRLVADNITIGGKRQDPAPQPPAPPVIAAPSGLRNAALAGLLGASAIGLPLAGAAAGYLLTRDKPAAVKPPGYIDTDTDTRTEIGIYREQ